MTSPTSKRRTCWKVCAAMGLAAITLLSAPRLADAQVVQGVEKGAREGNKAAGPVGGVLGGAIGGVVGVVTGVTGVLTGGNKGGQAPAAKGMQSGRPCKQGDTSKTDQGEQGREGRQAATTAAAARRAYPDRRAATDAPNRSSPTATPISSGSRRS